ncbi:MAG: VWA domain-containing protein [Candidatus Omnitrophica bacterium]|nr:VWA domain-containing protein [Candidatus Omnitrophota bacterium]
MQFFEPKAFIGLLAIPVLAGILIYSRHLWQKRLSRFTLLSTFYEKLIPNYRSSEWRLRSLCLILALFFSILALSRPQWGEEQRKVERKGIDIVFLMDTSLSMLAEDIAPNRLQKAKLTIKNFIHRLKGDRVGMVAFAGTSFLQAPLTLDYSAFLLFLDAIDTGYIPVPGTSLDQAIRLAIHSFPDKTLKHKVIILLTDGEDHEGGIEAALEASKQAGLKIYTIGFGTPQGAPIPLKSETGQRTGFKKDDTGQIVITKLNQPILEKIASETGGVYITASPGEQEVSLILKHLEGIGQKKFKERTITEREDHFQLFLFFALIFLALESFVRRIHKKRAQALMLLYAFFLFCGFFKSSETLIKEGNKNFSDKKYQTALENYRQAQIKNPDDPVVGYNLAATLYQTDEFRAALQNLEKVIQSESKIKDPVLKANAYYNYGNVQYRLGNFDKAIEAYQNALEINPKDPDAKYNLEFLQKQKSMFEKKDQERKKQQPQQKPQQQNKDQQQQEQKQNQQQNQDQQQNQNQQNQDQKDQQDQQQSQSSEQDQEKDKQDKQDQDQQPSQNQQKDQEDQKQQPQDQQNQDQKDQEQQNQQQQQNQPESGEKEEQPSQPKPEEGDQKQPQSGQENLQKGPKPLQGQMTMPEALRVLDALKDSEKELQDLRKPPANPQGERVGKDW